MTVPVLLAIAGPAEAALVAGWGSRRREVAVARRCADLADVLAAAGAGIARAAVLGADLPGADAEAVEALARAGVALVVLVPAGAPGDAAERRWRQFGATSFCREGEPAATVAATVVAATERSTRGRSTDVPAPESLPSTSPVEPTGLLPTGVGRVLAVWGPHGSTGRTTVAVNVAAELAATGSYVTLVDADSRGAAVAQTLGILDEAPGVLAAVRAATEGRLDSATLSRLAPHAVPGLSVLSGAPDPLRWNELRTVGLRRVLEVAAATADWVVVDLPGGLDEEDSSAGRDAVTRAVLESADGVLVVGAADPVGLQRWIRVWQRRADVVTGAAVVPVLNRVRASAVGHPAERRVADTVGRFAGADDVVLLPEDPAVDAALLAGRTLGEASQMSPLRRAIATLARDLDVSVPHPEQSEDPWGDRGFDPLLARS